MNIDNLAEREKIERGNRERDRERKRERVKEIDRQRDRDRQTEKNRKLRHKHTIYNEAVGHLQGYFNENFIIISKQ